MKWIKCLGLFLCVTLLVPGVAFGTVWLKMVHPPVVAIGQEFDVTVVVMGDDGINDPAHLCGYQTLIAFDDTMVELVGYRGESFFATSDMAGPCVYTPVGSDCGAPSLAGTFGSMDISLSTPVPWPYNRATATYTFKALQLGNIQFTGISPRNEFTDCALFLPELAPDDILNGSLDIQASIVPTLSQYGMAAFMLAMLLCAVTIMVRRGRARS